MKKKVYKPRYYRIKEAEKILSNKKRLEIVAKALKMPKQIKIEFNN